MSIERCDECNEQIDTDFDAECYTADDFAYCIGCRERVSRRAHREYIASREALYESEKRVEANYELPTIRLTIRQAS